MSRKGASGVRRSGGGSAMTPQDRWTLQDAESYVAHMNSEIPEYFKKSMTQDQIRAEVIKHVQERGALGVAGESVSRLDIDGRFPKPQDSRYDKLVNSMNSIDLRKVNTAQYGRERTSHFRGRSWHEDYFTQTAERITAGYSTKELGEFVKNELKETGHLSKGGRPNYQTAIMLSLQSRFISQGSGHRIRNTLGEPTSRLSSFVSHIKQSLDVREIYRRRAEAIRAKYKVRK